MGDDEPIPHGMDAMTLHLKQLAAGGALALAVAGTAVPAAAVQADGASTPGAWADAAAATIHPGILTRTGGTADCTANFVFTDADKAVYLGQAAHCAQTGDRSQLDGCRTTSMPLGTKVTLGESGVTGKLAYSSWQAMRETKESDPPTCKDNDFALVEIPADAVGKVNPSMPYFGGPTGVSDGVQRGDVVRSYGNSPIRGGLSSLSPKTGVSIGDLEGGWSHLTLTVTPGIPGDSGSGYLDPSGRALGVLSKLTLYPPASNAVTDLGRALDYARAHAGIEGLELARGTEPFLGGGAQ